ncbi:MAG: hypothetical protein KJO79_02075 [Verrucomicrobiae bacterium]|nr:hypothetical protein [Verrucomicrobiae bacterium]NNJ85940.1 hypothetical protein [Akkermansiaceae bacterium]
MKTKPLVILAFVFGLSMLAAEPQVHQSGQGPRHVRVMVEMIAMPLATHSALLDDEKASESDVVLRSEVSRLIQTRQAKLVDTHILIARSGEKSTSESRREFIFPTEYEPSEVPKVVLTQPNGSRVEGHDRSLATGPTPTAFVCRHLGSTLEIEPKITTDTNYIDLKLTPANIVHTKNAIFATWKDQHGTADIMMPYFYVLRLTTGLTVRNGNPALLGSLSPKNQQGEVDYSRKIMVFVKANIINPR